MYLNNEFCSTIDTKPALTKFLDHSILVLNKLHNISQNFRRKPANWKSANLGGELCDLIFSETHNNFPGSINLREAKRRRPARGARPRTNSAGARAVAGVPIGGLYARQRRAGADRPGRVKRATSLTCHRHIARRGQRRRRQFRPDRETARRANGRQYFPLTGRPAAERGQPAEIRARRPIAA